MMSQKVGTKRLRRKTKHTKKGQCRHLKLRGIEIPFDATARSSRASFPDAAKDIFVPFSLQPLDDFIESLQDECRGALRAKYITGEAVNNHWLERAEHLVMLR